MSSCANHYSVVPPKLSLVAIVILFGIVLVFIEILSRSGSTSALLSLDSQNDLRHRLVATEFFAPPPASSPVARKQKLKPLDEYEEDVALKGNLASEKSSSSSTTTKGLSNNSSYSTSSDSSPTFISGHFLAKYIEENLLRFSTKKSSFFQAWNATSCVPRSYIRCSAIGRNVGGPLPELDVLRRVPKVIKISQPQIPKRGKKSESDDDDDAEDDDDDDDNDDNGDDDDDDDNNKKKMKNSENGKKRSTGEPNSRVPSSSSSSSSFVTLPALCCPTAMTGRWTAPFQPDAFDVLSSTPIALDKLLQRNLNDDPENKKRFRESTSSSPSTTTRTNSSSETEKQENDDDEAAYLLPPSTFRRLLSSGVGKTEEGQRQAEILFALLGKRLLQGDIPVEQSKMMLLMGLSRMNKVDLSVVVSKAKNTSHYNNSTNNAFESKTAGEVQQQQPHQQRRVTTNSEKRKIQKAVRIFLMGNSYVRSLISNFAAIMRGQGRYFDRGCHTAMRYVVTNYGDYFWFADKVPKKRDRTTPIFPDFVQVDRHDEVVFFEVTYVFSMRFDLPEFTMLVGGNATSNGKSTKRKIKNKKRGRNDNADVGNDETNNASTSSPSSAASSPETSRLASYTPKSPFDPLKRYGGSYYSAIFIRLFVIASIHLYQNDSNAMERYVHFQLTNHFGCHILGEPNSKQKCFMMLIQTPYGNQFQQDVSIKNENASNAIYERLGKRALGQVRDAYNNVDELSKKDQKGCRGGFPSPPSSPSASSSSPSSSAWSKIPSWIIRGSGVAGGVAGVGDYDNTSGDDVTSSLGNALKSTCFANNHGRNKNTLLGAPPRHLFLPAPDATNEPFRVEDDVDHSQCIATYHFPDPVVRVNGGQRHSSNKIARALKKKKLCQDSLSRSMWFKFSLGALLSFMNN